MHCIPFKFLSRRFSLHIPGDFPEFEANYTFGIKYELKTRYSNTRRGKFRAIKWNNRRKNKLRIKFLLEKNVSKLITLIHILNDHTNTL